MKRFAVLLAALTALAAPAFAQTRTIAVTIDDLPYATGGVGCTDAEARAFTSDFLTMLKAQEVPVVGFAIPGRGCGGQPAQADLIEAWLEAGFEIGSHSNTHPNLNQVGLEAYEADVAAAEPVLKPMLARHGRTLTWYRHPYLRTGETEEIRAGLASFLAGRGYRVAPVTFDNSEWVYAAAYAKALKKGDAAEARRIGEAYVEHMQVIAIFFETWGKELVGYEPPQILLIHANQLNRDWFPAVKAMLAGRGYGFVSLEQAMADPAYARPDVYVGRYGMSWLLRWGRADGRNPPREPDPPDWVTALSEAPLTATAQPDS